MIPGHDVGLEMHLRLLHDAARLDAFDRAIRAVVRPGDVVLDVGSGTGVLALLAARAGAARVHAVESMPIADLIPALAAANGLADRIVVHRADLAAMAPVEPVDVVLGEWLGRFVVDDGMFAAVRASGAWLRPGGRCVPARVRAVLGLVGAPLPSVGWWRQPVRGLDFSPLVPAARDACAVGSLDRSSFLGEPVVARELVPPDVGTWPPIAVALPVAEDGTLHALAGWFEADLADGVTLCTGPGHSTHWGQILWPVAPLAVRAGLVAAALRALDGERWRWTARVLRDGHEVAAHAGTTDRDAWRPGEAAPAVGQPAAALNDEAVAAARAGDLQGAIDRLRDATRARPDAATRAVVNENLGIFLANLGDWAGAVAAFLEAIDGDVASRPQSARFLVACATRAGFADTARWRAAFEQAHGPWTDPWEATGGM